MGLGCEAGFFLFMCFLSAFKRWKGCERDEGKRERVAHKVCPSRVVRVLYLYRSVCLEGTGQCERQ